jgi:predicted MFS family arabinose efflux permease
LSAPEERGKVVGTIMSGLLVGILLSRTLSGFIGDTLGWHVFGLPQDYVSYYFLSSRNNFLIISQSLMARTNNYWFAFHLNQGATFMREATLINVFSAQFGAWTTMVLLLSEEPFNFTSTTIGLFGIIGASGWQLL